MLEKQEIERIAGIKGLSIKNTEKDYLLEMVLYVIYRQIGRKLIFKGGTALYKLHSLNRFSEDLDFTVDASKLEVNTLFDKIIKNLKGVNINGRIKEISDYKNQKNIKLELKGPLFDGNIRNITIITINISLKEKPLLEPEQRTIFSQYTDIPSFEVFAMPLEEMLAEKIRALMTREKARDVYDVWFLLKKGVKLNIAYLNKKLKLYSKHFNNSELKKRIEEERKNWSSDLNSIIIGNLPSFDNIKKDIESLI